MKSFLVVLWLIAASTFAFANEEHDQPCPDQLLDNNGEQPSKKWEITLSPYTHHWHDNPEHKHVFLGAVDRHISGNRFCGLALFTNSFGQNSAYLYVGKQWNSIWGNHQLFSKVSAGLLYGYHGQYKNKIPLNNYGIAPAIIPSLGYAITPNSSAQIFILGTAGLLFAYSHSY